MKPPPALLTTTSEDAGGRQYRERSTQFRDLPLMCPGLTAKQNEPKKLLPQQKHWKKAQLGTGRCKPHA
jgi:hypothetical protein